MVITKLKANTNKRKNSASIRRSVSIVIEQYANEVQGIQTRREEE